MDQKQVELYQQIQAFELDKADSRLPFSRRLARENGWSDDYTRRVMDEYKKFAWLAMTAGHPVSPSDQVDQAWHMHLTYTRSYWEEFCPKVLGKPLHHEPTQGGQEEGAKFNDLYRKTLASYEKLFGQQPPEDIWPEPAIRFGRDIHHVRVNSSRYWLLPKPSISPSPWRPISQRALAWLGLLSIPALTMGCSGIPVIINPMQWIAVPFLIFYAVLGLLVLGFVNYMSGVMRKPDGKNMKMELSLSPEELAYLADGPERAVYIALINLIQRDGVVFDKSTSSLKLNEPCVGNTPLEEDIIKLISEAFDPNVKKISLAAKPFADYLRPRLDALGLYTQKAKLKNVRRMGVLAFLPLLLIGIDRLIHGLAIGKPVDYLVALMMLTYFMGYSFFSGLTGRSRYGDLVLNYEKQKGIDKSSGNGLLYAVATAGLSAVSGTVLADLILPLERGSVGGGADGGDGGDGGGGCGGCGGCG